MNFRKEKRIDSFQGGEEFPLRVLPVKTGSTVLFFSHTFICITSFLAKTLFHIFLTRSHIHVFYLLFLKFLTFFSLFFVILQLIPENPFISFIIIFSISCQVFLQLFQKKFPHLIKNRIITAFASCLISP